jgi:DNA-binding HxlR family transcriptional regulator
MTVTEPQPADLSETRPAKLDGSSDLNPTGADRLRTGQGHQDDYVFLQALLDVRHLLAAEWSSDILTVLQPRSLRYTELLDAVRSLNVVDRRTGRRRYPQTRTFIGTLRRMELIGLINRSELVGVWPREVRYSLTAFARGLIGALSLTVAWHERYEDDLRRS